MNAKHLDILKQGRFQQKGWTLQDNRMSFFHEHQIEAVCHNFIKVVHMVYIFKLITVYVGQNND